jgi:two-component system phosphate regulon sensor histidine kinase PhoR
MDEEIKLINKLLGDQAWLLTTVLSANKSGIVITDQIAEDQPIIYCNDAFLIMTGYSREEVIGRNCRFLQGTQLKSHSRTRIKMALDNGRTCNERIINHKKDGSAFINDLYIAPIRDVNGTVTHYIGVQNQINEVRASSINSSGNEGEMVENELNLMSHELRTPLTALKGCLQLMSRTNMAGDPFAEQRVLLEKSSACLSRLSKAIENVIQTRG